MTKVSVKAVTTFSHGALDAFAGQTYEITKGEAQELAKHGFVSFDQEPSEAQEVSEDPRANQPQEHQAGDVVTDNPETGEPDVKEAAPVENKMESAPDNKSSGKKTTTAKK